MVEQMVKVVEERGRGTRGGPYVYVVEGDELVHISEYAAKKLEYEDEAVYEVPRSKLVGKIIYCFEFSRSGGRFLIKCGIDDFEDGRPKRCEHAEFSEIRNLRFLVKNPTLKYLLRQFEEVFIPIINELKEYERALNFEILFMGHQSRLRDAYEDPELYYFTFMSLPKDRSRISSLKVTRRWLYQVWLLKLVCEALGVSKFKLHEWEGKPFWWIEQGSKLSTSVAETPFGDVTFWLEFQPSKYAHMIGILTEKRVPVRPDIVVVKGCFRRTRDFVDSKKPIDLIIECKEDPFNKWRGEINSQILPYQEAFKPRNFIVASLEPVPVKEKKYLERQGIKVVDNLKPKSENIGMLHSIIESVSL